MTFIHLYMEVERLKYITVDESAICEHILTAVFGNITASCFNYVAPWGVALCIHGAGHWVQSLPDLVTMYMSVTAICQVKSLCKLLF